MLVLSRKREEALMIGKDVEVVVVDIRGDRVRLGIRAPAEVHVHRREVYEHIRTSLRHVPVVQKMSVSADWSLHAPFLRAAIDEAKKGLAEGGLPIGSVLVRGNEIIGRGHNRRVQNGDPMAHAEIDCFTNAGRQKTYKDTTLYSTLMPCYLCSGAAVQFAVPKVVVGESVNYPGECKHGEGGRADRGGSADFMKSHAIDVVDLHDAECIEMMQTFIKDRPSLWNEDIGEEGT